MPHTLALRVEVPRLEPPPGMLGMRKDSGCATDAELCELMPYLDFGWRNPPRQFDGRLRTDLLNLGGTDVGRRDQRCAVAQKAAVHDMAYVRRSTTHGC